jgi:hypothetical protein
LVVEDAGTAAGVTFDAEFAFAALTGWTEALDAPEVPSDFFMGLGASTPAVLDPNPSFCKVVASIFPLEFSPFAD